MQTNGPTQIKIRYCDPDRRHRTSPTGLVSHDRIIASGCLSAIHRHACIYTPRTYRSVYSPLSLRPSLCFRRSLFCSPLAGFLMTSNPLISLDRFSTDPTRALWKMLSPRHRRFQRIVMNPPQSLLDTSAANNPVVPRGQINRSSFGQGGQAVMMAPTGSGASWSDTANASSVLETAAATAAAVTGSMTTPKNSVAATASYDPDSFFTDDVGCRDWNNDFGRSDDIERRDALNDHGKPNHDRHLRSDRPGNSHSQRDDLIRFDPGFRLELFVPRLDPQRYFLVISSSTSTASSASASGHR